MHLINRKANLLLLIEKVHKLDTIFFKRPNNIGQHLPCPHIYDVVLYGVLLSELFNIVRDEVNIMI